MAGLGNQAARCHGSRCNWGSDTYSLVREGTSIRGKLRGRRKLSLFVSPHFFGTDPSRTLAFEACVSAVCRTQRELERGRGLLGSSRAPQPRAAAHCLEEVQRRVEGNRAEGYDGLLPHTLRSGIR